MPEKTFDDAELRDRLTPEQYQVTQQAGTERAFTGCYWDTKTPGTYHCVVCDEELFTSDTKYDSGSGWPSFYQAMDDGKVTRHEDRCFGDGRASRRLCSPTCVAATAAPGHVPSPTALPPTRATGSA